MNREEIIDKLEIIDASQHALRQTSWKEHVDVLERFAALAIAKYRERLAAGVELPKAIERDDTEHGVDYCTLDQLRDYGDRRAAAEREECAKLSDDMGGIAACSRAIRARGQQ